MGQLLERQHQYYIQNKEMLMEHYGNQWIVIVDEKVVDGFGSERDAYIYCVKNFTIGTFFIQHVI